MPDADDIHDDEAEREDEALDLIYSLIRRRLRQRDSLDPLAPTPETRQRTRDQSIGLTRRQPRRKQPRRRPQGGP